MSNRVRPRTPPARSRPAPKADRRLPVWIPLAILGVVAVFVLIGFVAASQSSDDDGFAFGQVDYIGDVLPQQPEAGADAAIGMTAGQVRGFAPDGTEQVFANGSPRALMFVAHWCPHCQDELDAIATWEEAGNAFPDGVDIQTIATWTERGRPNYPPGEWLADNGWDHPTIVDNEQFLLATAFGLGGTPMWIFVDADGTIVDRTGSLTPDQLAARMATLLA